MNIRLAATAALMVAALGGCASTSDALSGTGRDVTAAAAAPVVARSQAEALGLIGAVDQHEIRLAQQAKAKGVTGGALDYANMMIAHHTDNLAQTTALLAPIGGMPNTAGVQKLKSMSDTAYAQLDTLTGDAYRRAYIDRMVLDHRMTLAVLDASMPLATDAAVHAHVMTTRAAVQQHLDQAIALQSAR